MKFRSTFKIIPNPVQIFMLSVVASRAKAVGGDSEKAVRGMNTPCARPICGQRPPAQRTRQSPIRSSGIGASELP
jgi:hypothetical protein